MTCVVLSIFALGCSDSIPQTAVLEDGTPNFSFLFGGEYSQVVTLENAWSIEAPQWDSLFFATQADFGSLNFFTAVTEIDDTEARARIVTQSLAPRFPGGTVALAFDEEGAIRRAALWGHPDFDEDTLAAWENFYRQFAYGRSSVRADMALTDSARDEHVTVTGSDEGVAAWLHHIRGMVGTNWLIRRTFAESANGSVAPAEWYEEQQAFFQSMANQYEPLLAAHGGSPAAQEYADLAQRAADDMAPVIEAARVSDGSKVRDLVGSLRRNTCGGCHNVESHQFGPEMGIRDGMRDLFPELGIRKDIFRVNHDLWGVPGREADSQYIADVARIIAVAAGETSW